MGPEHPSAGSASTSGGRRRGVEDDLLAGETRCLAIAQADSFGCSNALVVLSIGGRSQPLLTGSLGLIRTAQSVLRAQTEWSARELNCPLPWLW
jgi:hypothetical protein